MNSFFCVIYLGSSSVFAHFFQSIFLSLFSLSWGHFEIVITNGKNTVFAMLKMRIFISMTQIKWTIVCTIVRSLSSWIFSSAFLLLLLFSFLFIYLSVFAWIFFCVNLPNLHNSFVILNAIAGFFFTPMSQRVEAVAHSDKIYALAVMLRYVRALKRKKERKTKKIHTKTE